MLQSNKLMPKPFFSVIIPAYNEELLLPRLLDALTLQTFKDFEVILVDANSSDNSINKAKKFENKLDLKILNTKLRNVSSSRNLGAKKAQGENLFFIDADNFINSNFLEIVSRKMKLGYQMIVPSITPDSQSKRYQLAYKTTNMLVSLAKEVNLTFSTGGNMVIKKELFDQLNGFDATIFVGEDHDLVNRAKKAKAKILFSREAKVIFSVRRLEKEGGKLYLKYFLSTFYIVLFGKMTKKLYNYEMGGKHFKKRP